MVDLEIDGDVVTTTEDHPFWNVTDRQWQEAQELDAGDRVLTAQGGTAVVAAIKLPTQRVASAFNLTVDDIHTYYVAVGEHDVLVHNQCPGGGHNPGDAGAKAPAIGFAEGFGETALTPGRLQHGTKNLSKKDVLPAWSGKNSPGIIQRVFVPILERPSVTFDHTLGDTRVRGFLGDIDGHQVAVFVFKEGPYQGELASSVVPTTNQLKKWGIA